MSFSTFPKLLIGVVAWAVVLGAVAVGAATSGDDLDPADVETLLSGPTLDGSGNNVAAPAQGSVGTNYPRMAPANYADGIGAPISGPAPPRYVSNRIYNDGNQNVFSERGVTHWGVVWGQFLDHSFGLRQVSDEAFPLGFDAADPLEAFSNPNDTMPFTRSAIAPDTGVSTPREQINTVSSYIDAWAVYGGTDERLDWLRAGDTLDGDPTNNDAHLLLNDGYLPTASDRPGTDAPVMEPFGIQFADPTGVVIAGDERANENLALTSVHTLFAREHNRIVDALPDDLPEEVKFQIARRVVIAEQQWITYNEFLPAVGVTLPAYGGYDPTVDASITNEFATVGYRAHSQIHGEFEMAAPAGAHSEAELAAIAETGVEVIPEGDEIEFVIPLNVAFGRPELVSAIGLGNVLAGLAGEANYANEELIDNQLRSVLFQAPNADPDDCLDGPELPQCFTSVLDLGALDLARGQDHGMPLYNDLRVALGLAPKVSFTDITGEATEELPAGMTIDDPAILDFVELRDRDGQVLAPDSDAAEAETVVAIRTTTTAARLQAIYGSVDQLDAFTGMMAESHVAGTEFGELQLAMWTTQFQRLRDGDRFFYGNDPTLDLIADQFGVSFQTTLSDVIVANTDLGDDGLPDDVFLLDLTADDDDDDVPDPTTTTVGPPTTSEDPTTTAVDPTTTVEDPTTTAVDPTTTVEDPTTTGGETTTTVGPPTTSEDPTTTAVDPTTSSEDPTTTSEEPSTTAVDPTTTVDETTTTAGPPTTTRPHSRWEWLWRLLRRIFGPLSFR